MIQTTINNQYEVKLHEHIIKLCHKLTLPLHYNHKGPKIYTNYQRVAMIILYIRSKKSLIEFLREFVETKWVSWLGLKEIPGKSTLNDWMKIFDLAFIRHLLNRILEKETPKLMAIDATGFDSWQKNRHYERRIKQCGFSEDHMPYAKVDIIVDTDTLLIYDWVLRIKPRHDVLGAKTILSRLRHKGVLILADRGYDSEPLHKQAIENGNLLFAPVRNMKKNPKGYNQKRCLTKIKEYSMRNTVESVNHALKSMKNELRSKLHYLKKREFGWTVILFNMKRIINTVQATLNLLIEYLFRMCPIYSIENYIYVSGISNLLCLEM